MHDLGHDHRWLLAGSTQATITGAEPTLGLPDIVVYSFRPSSRARRASLTFYGAAVRPSRFNS